MPPVSPPALNLRPGGSTWLLPANGTIAAVARTCVSEELGAIGLPEDAVESAALMVSELATNAHKHAISGSTSSCEAAELWLYPRATDSGHADLVIAVFDRRPERLPQLRDLDVLAEHGRGLALIDCMAGGRWGYHRTHSRLCEKTVEGKAVWVAVPVPAGAPHLELLARELSPYGDVVSAEVMRPIDRPAHLHVALVGDEFTRAEQITHTPGDGSPADFRWTWGEPVKGHELCEKALTIVHTLAGRL